MVESQEYRTKYAVVGSGAGGATAFAEIACRGEDAILIEEGLSLDQEFFRRPIDEVTRIAYRHGGLLPIIGSPMIPYAEGRCVGGTTELNGALIWRTPEFVRREWVEKYGLGRLFGTDLDRHFDFIEKRLSVRKAESMSGTDRDSLLLRQGALDLGWEVAEVPRAAPKCVKSNRCGSGCPAGAKETMSRTLIQDGILGGGRVLDGLKAKRIVKLKGGSFEIRCLDVRTRREVRVRTQKVISAGGATQTPHLLFHSGLGKRVSPICFHLNLKILAEFDEQVRADRGTIFTSQIQEFIEQRQLMMATNFRPEYVSMSFSWLAFEHLKSILGRLDRLALYTTQVAPLTRGRIVSIGDNSYLFHRLDTNDFNLSKQALRRCALALFTAGAKRVWIPINGSSAVENMKDLDQTLLHAKPSQFVMSTVHLMSSKPISNKLQRDKCAPDGSPGGVDGVHVVDSSALPSWTIESPQGTIMAMSRQICEHLLSKQ